MTTYCATKLTTTCAPMIGQFVNTMILPSTGTEQVACGLGYDCGALWLLNFQDGGEGSRK